MKINNKNAFLTNELNQLTLFKRIYKRISKFNNYLKKLKTFLMQVFFIYFKVLF